VNVHVPVHGRESR